MKQHQWIHIHTCDKCGPTVKHVNGAISHACAFELKHNQPLPRALHRDAAGNNVTLSVNSANKHTPAITNDVAR
jgi:hypothetical protein